MTVSLEQMVYRGRVSQCLLTCPSRSIKKSHTVLPNESRDDVSMGHKLPRPPTSPLPCSHCQSQQSWCQPYVQVQTEAMCYTPCFALWSKLTEQMTHLPQEPPIHRLITHQKTVTQHMGLNQPDSLGNINTKKQSLLAAGVETKWSRLIGHDRLYAKQRSKNAEYCLRSSLETREI